MAPSTPFALPSLVRVSRPSVWGLSSADRSSLDPAPVQLVVGAWRREIIAVRAFRGEAGVTTNGGLPRWRPTSLVIIDADAGATPAT